MTRDYMFEELRLYGLINMHCEGIHAGIQAAHAIANLASIATKRPDANSSKLYNNWFERDQTIILKNGGNHKSMTSLMDYKTIGAYTPVSLKHAAEILELPIAGFVEPNLNYALTAIALVVPMSILTWEQPPNSVVDISSYPPRYVDIRELTTKEKAIQFIAKTIQNAKFAR